MAEATISQARPPAGLPVTSALDPARAEALRSVGAAFGRTRLRTLVSLRWMAIAGQALAVLFVHYMLGFELPLAACLAAVGASAWLNVALMAVFPSQHLSSPAETAGQLAFDTVQLSVLIGLTGGLQNPFLLMILAPVTVGASRLLPAYSGALALLALVCCGGMWLWGLDLPWREDQAFDIPPLYQAGQLAAVAIGLIFFTVSAWRTARDEARLVSALDAVQAVLAREQQLSALGALAAATAHELGTPLATIHLAAKEAGRSVKPGHPAREDVELIIEQSERCRTILKQISQRRHMTDAAMARATLPSLIEEAAEPHRGTGIHVQCSCSPLAGGGGLDDRAPEVDPQARDHPRARRLHRERGELCGQGSLRERALVGGRSADLHHRRRPGICAVGAGQAGRALFQRAPDRAARRRHGPRLLHCMHAAGAHGRARNPL